MSLDEPLSIRQLEVFAALVDHGSFTKAARHLGLSQSTVSGHVADLERRLGALVVERGRRNIRPTSVGAALLGPARSTLKAERSARMSVQELTGLISGSLTVGGSTIPATYLLPAWFARYHEQHPEITLRLVTGDSRDVLDRVRAADVEVALVGSAADHSGLESSVVAQDRLVYVVRSDHEWARRDHLTIEDVLSGALVCREEGSGTREATFQMLAAAGASTRSLKILCEVGSAESLKGAVRAGLGAAFVSDLSVREEVEAGVLTALPVTGVESIREFHLVTRKGALLGPAARAFRDLVLEA